MLRELENGRLVRLLTKFGFINERPEYVILFHTSIFLMTARKGSTTILDGLNRVTAI